MERYTDFINWLNFYLESCVTNEAQYIQNMLRKMEGYTDFINWLNFYLESCVSNEAQDIQNMLRETEDYIKEQQTIDRRNSESTC
jgi:phosphoserine phosphatase